MSQVNFSFLCFSNEHFIVLSSLLTLNIGFYLRAYHCREAHLEKASGAVRVEEIDPLVNTTNTSSFAILLRIVNFLDLCHEVDASALLTIALIVEIGRVANLGNGRSLLRVVSEESDDQVFESGCQIHTIDSLEICVIALLPDHIVVFIFEDLGAVRELALHDDEKKDTH